MNKNNVFRKIVFLSFAGLMILACTGGGLLAPPTPTPTIPPPPTDTATPRPTSTPVPTATEKIPPTPSSVGDTVRSDSFEVTVVSAKELTRVYMGSYYYYPKADQIFVEAVIRVSNLGGSKASIPWKKVYVVETSGDSWYPTWGGYKATSSGVSVDGSTVGVNQITDGDAVLEFEEDAVLRVIWFLTRKNPTTAFFVFFDSPTIKIVVE